MPSARVGANQRHHSSSPARRSRQARPDCLGTSRPAGCSDSRRCRDPRWASSLQHDGAREPRHGCQMLERPVTLPDGLNSSRHLRRISQIARCAAGPLSWSGGTRRPIRDARAGETLHQGPQVTRPWWQASRPMERGAATPVRFRGEAPASLFGFSAALITCPKHIGPRGPLSPASMLVWTGLSRANEPVGGTGATEEPVHHLGVVRSRVAEEGPRAVVCMSSVCVPQRCLAGIGHQATAERLSRRRDHLLVHLPSLRRPRVRTTGSFVNQPE